MTINTEKTMCLLTGKQPIGMIFAERERERDKFFPKEILSRALRQAKFGFLHLYYQSL